MAFIRLEVADIRSSGQGFAPMLLNTDTIIRAEKVGEAAHLFMRQGEIYVTRATFDEVAELLTGASPAPVTAPAPERAERPAPERALASSAPFTILTTGGVSRRTVAVRNGKESVSVRIGTPATDEFLSAVTFSADEAVQVAVALLNCAENVEYGLHTNDALAVHYNMPTATSFLLRKAAQ